MTTIFTDSFKSYSKLVDLGFEHKMIYHKLKFVDTENTNLHTQRIESLWRQCKEKFKDIHGCDRVYFKGT